ncbi:hypothetical protein PG997_010239 [Apiospora hydei]|uniref:Uncharacterized protein n=1 Tax=Apiospora hydei TaxID=1337664 RepID=A0ABR1VZ10_9PEZI
MLNNQGNVTSGELDYRSQRRWARIKKCEPVVADFLAKTPQLSGLNAAQKAEILDEVKTQLVDNVNDFMDTNPPRTVYPMKEAVRATLKSIFCYNENKFGVQWTADMFDDKDEEAGQNAGGNSGANAGQDAGQNSGQNAGQNARQNARQNAGQNASPR